MAYVAWKGDKLLVVVDGKEGPAYDEIGEGDPIFSPDGKRVAYVAWKGDKQLVVVDGEEGPAYDGIIRNGPTFCERGALEYLAQKDGVLFRIKHVPVKKK